MPPLIHRLFFRPVDASSLAVFRIVFGALMLFEAVNYGGFLCLDCMYRDTDFLFKYHHFEWARMLPGRGLEIVFVVMGLAATGVMLGLFYRLSAVLLLVYVQLPLPARPGALPEPLLPGDHLLRDPRVRAGAPHTGRSTRGAARTSHPPRCPTGAASGSAPSSRSCWIYAGHREAQRGLAEPRADAAVDDQPERRRGGDLPVADPGLGDRGGELRGSIALHLIGAPLLLWKRTRLAVFCVYAVFHTINAFVFNIGIFPWMTLGATLLLFDPDWPRQVLRWLDARGVGWAQTPRASARSRHRCTRRPGGWCTRLPSGR